MTQQNGLPEPPPVGAQALPEGTYAGTGVFVTGGGTGLGKAIATEFGRLGADVVIASRKAEHLGAGRDAIEALGARVLGVTCDIRDPDQVGAAFDQATATFGLPGVLINNVAANFPVPAEDMSPNAWRTSSTSHSTAPSSARVSSHVAISRPERQGPSSTSGRPTPGRVVRVSRIGRREGGGQEHGGDARRGMGALWDPGERAGPRTLPARGHDG